MNMKKNLIALLLAMAMVCSLAACGGNQPAEEETDAPAVEETLPEAEDVVTELPEVDPGVSMHDIHRHHEGHKDSLYGHKHH